MLGDPQDRRQADQDQHLVAEVRADPGPRPPADHRPQRQQAEHDRRTAPGVDARRTDRAAGGHAVEEARPVPRDRRGRQPGPGPGDELADHAAGQVAEPADRQADRHERPGAVPGLDQSAELDQPDEVQGEVDEAEVDERGRDQPPGLPLADLGPGHVAEPVARHRRDRAGADQRPLGGRPPVPPLDQVHQGEDQHPRRGQGPSSPEIPGCLPAGARSHLSNAFRPRSSSGSRRGCGRIRGHRARGPVRPRPGAIRAGPTSCNPAAPG